MYYRYWLRILGVFIIIGTRSSHQSGGIFGLHICLGKVDQGDLGILPFFIGMLQCLPDHKINMVYEQAERLEKSAPNASESAHSIMKRYEECLNRIRSKTLRDEYESLCSRIKKELHPLIK